MTVEAKTRLDLLDILEKASSMAERLGGAFVPADSTGEAESAEIEARLLRWCQNAGRGDRAKFEKRLARDGLTVEAVRRMLGPVRLADGQPLPNWLYTLDEALSSLPLSVAGTLAEDRCLDRTIPIPFQEVWLPFIRLARQRLSAGADARYRLLSTDAHILLERALLRTLVTLGAQSLYVEFTAYQALRSPTRLLDFIQPDADDVQLPEKPSGERYSQFVQDLLNGGLIDFFKEYTVAARLTALATDHWVESSAQFLMRLAADLPDLQSCFAANADLGTVVGVTAGLSDPHRNGQSVIALHFASGLKLIYKPRDTGLETAYNRLLNWLNEQGITPAFKVLRILERPGYGWVEYVEHLSCQTEDEAALYYRRAGMHLGLFYLLRGSDCHYGNLIACGPYPVIIDLEVMLNPVLAENSQVDTADPPQEPDLQLYQNTVLTSGLLPIWDKASDGTIYDMSGFGGSVTRQSFLRPEWYDVNTDRMRLVKRKQAVPETSAVPYLDRTALSTADYVDEVVAGFEWIVRFILDRRANLQDPDGPLSAFRHRRARFVFRNTSLYDQLRELAFAPRLMKNGVDQSIHFDLACLALISSDTTSPFWSMLKEEVHALEQMDIPLFGMYTDEKAVLSDTDTVIVANAFVDDGYHLTVMALDNLGESDIALQSSFVRAAIVTKRTERPSRHTPEAPPSDAQKLPLLTGAQFVEEAVQLSDRLQRAAIRSGSSMVWITLEYTAELERYELKPVDHSLYSGLLGIALFFGALAQATRVTTYRDQTLAVIQDLRADLAQGNIHRAARLGQRLGLGAAYGIGAVVYALTRLSTFLGDDALLAEAHRASALLTPQIIADDSSLDIFSGCAGAILGFLALYDQSPDQHLLDQAWLCGKHLLETRRTTSVSEQCAWVTLNGTILTGFSHGAAGISYALARLYGKVGETEFRDAAREAAAYEHSVFSPQARNWPDFRFPASGEPVFTTSWCHGAPGIALARIGSLDCIDAEDIRQDLDAALETTQTMLSNRGDVDHLCCGTLGRVETLWKAGQVLARPNLLEAAWQASTDMVYRARQRGSYYLFAGLPDGIDNPGFFQGAAGIGYQWLRLAYPDKFPSVLMWE